MPSTPCRVAVIAIASIFSLTLVSGGAFAKSARSKSRAAAAAAASATLQGAGAGSYYAPSTSGNIYAPHPVSRGNVIDNTAGWGDVGAR